MHMHHLNWLAILVAAVSSLAAGFLWYSPMLFAKPWMHEMGYDPNDNAQRCRKVPDQRTWARLWQV